MRKSPLRTAMLGNVMLGVAAAAALVVAAQSVEPVYVGRAPVVRRLVTATWQDSAALRAPWARGGSEIALASARFEADRQAFVRDLVGTGRISAARADSVATFAVREAYKRRVPPALVFGVLLTENSAFKSRARSSVGAVGLMQIYPKVWVPTLGRVFGRNLQDDQTNLRYGVHILSHYVYSSARPGASAPDSALRKGLLRYNGCVRGANTPGCHRYPDKVRTAVERYAVAQCAGVGYDGCVAQPLRLSLAVGPSSDAARARTERAVVRSPALAR